MALRKRYKNQVSSHAPTTHSQVFHSVTSVFLLPIIALKLIGLDFVGAVLVDIETRHIKSWTALASYLGPKSCCYESELTNISTLPA